MTPGEKYLYHQIHPLKLATDISSGLASCVWVWQHQLGIAALVAFVPAIVMSAILITFAPLEKQKASAFGRYVRAMMNRFVEAQRLAGQVIMWLGAYHHLTWVMALGALVIVLAGSPLVNGGPPAEADDRRP